MTHFNLPKIVRLNLLKLKHCCSSRKFPKKKIFYIKRHVILCITEDICIAEDICFHVFFFLLGDFEIFTGMNVNNWVVSSNTFH